jgi:hypothetical protein
VNATIGNGQAVATILNDDGGRGKRWVGPSSGGSWSNASNWSPSGIPGSDSLVSISGATVNLTSNASVSELSMDAGAALRLAAAGNRTLRTAGLFLDSNSVLDLSDNELLIDYTDDSPAPAIRELLLSGRNGGAWNGMGITSSAAAAAPQTTLGYHESGESILVRHTLLGDANLDGGVDITDLGILATNWQQSGRSFSHGDFDYSDTVDITDLGILATNWQQRVEAPSPAESSVLNRRTTTLRIIDDLNW